MTRYTSPTSNSAVNSIMFMGDTGQPDAIKDHTKPPDNIIQIGVVIGDPSGHVSIPRATVTMTIQKRQHPFRTFPIGNHTPPTASF